MIRLTCPSCRQQQTFSAEAEGRQQCRHCGAVLRLRKRLARPPQPQELVSIPVLPRGPRKQSPVVRYALPAGVGVLLLVIGAAVGHNLSQTPAEKQQPRAAAEPKQERPPARETKPSQPPPKPAPRAEKKELAPRPDPVKPSPRPQPEPEPEPKKTPPPVKEEKPSPKEPEPAATPLPAGSAENILLPAKTLQALRKKVAANTPAWRAFKARLDKNLTELFRASYQGSQLPWISDYALGYLLLKTRDPAAASRYADKAIALLESALRDFQKGGALSRRFLARGDGRKRTFSLPHRNVLPATLRVYLAPVATRALKRGKPDTQDTLDYCKIFLKVSNSSDGPADYEEGKDWRHNPDLANNLIDWSPSGKEPAPGAAYYVTFTSGYSARLVKHAFQGHSVTLAAPPSAGEAVFVDYVCGVHSRGGSALAYQQTGAGDGGFNSILIDTTYTSRYLGKHVAMGLDWLDGYRGLTPGLRTQALDLLLRWSDFVRDKSYFNTAPGSNYGVGGYVSRVMTALALGRRHPAGPRLLAEVVAYRKKYVLPVLQGDTASLKGGFWAEGWNYGQLAAQNLVLAALALEAAGVIPDAAAERHWAGEVVEFLVHAQPTRNTVYDGGDWFAYPAPFPGKELFYVLGGAADDSQARAHAHYILRTYPGKHADNYLELLYQDASASAFWSSLPLQYYARGTGLSLARSDWGANPTWVSFQLGNLLRADHQSYCPGQLQIQRGADDLLINASAPGNLQSGVRKSSYGNVVIVDDNGEKLQVYPHCMGLWYGTPGVVMRSYEVGKDYVYGSGDYRAAYSSNRRPGDGGPVTELTRQVVYLRPNRVVVYDRVATRKETHAKQLRWHFRKEPKVQGSAFEAAAGKSVLFGQTFASVSLQTTVAQVKVGRASVAQLITQGPPARSIRFVTVFQVAAVESARRDSATRVVSADSLMEGARIGNQLVLFARQGEGHSPPAFTYSPGEGAVRTLLADLRPGHKYQIAVDGAVQLAETASPAGTLSFTSPVGAKTVAVTAVPLFRAVKR